MLGEWRTTSRALCCADQR